jgi:hypothetical protein
MRALGRCAAAELVPCRALNDFDHYRNFDRVPLQNSADASIPVSIRTVERDLAALGLLEPGEKYLQPSTLRAAIERWVDLHDARSMGTVEEASESFQGKIETFMTNRFGGLRMWKNKEVPERIPRRGVMADAKFDSPTSPDIASGLFRVTVRCNNTGYRIIVSPAYFIDWSYFGSPSTPVTREMLPGRYIFGTDSINGSIIPDKLVFRIPSDFTPDLKGF